MRAGPLQRTAVILAALSIAGHGACYSYRTIRAERRLFTEAVAGPAAPVVRVQACRFLARMNRPGPLALINNRAVDLAAAGRTGEAEILFREVVAEGPNEPAGYNNLAVACELAGRRDEALRMYHEACRLDPRNAHFSSNFRTFADFRGEVR